MGHKTGRRVSDHTDSETYRTSRVLAHGLWLKTVRRGPDVVREPQRWCPRPIGAWLLAGLLAGATRFGGYLAVPPIRPVVGCDGPLLIQPYLENATPLRRLSPTQLADPAVLHSLRLFWEAVANGWTKIGWLPDIGGRVYLPWELYRPLLTDNVLIDESGKCWLVDVGASATFHSARSPLGRLHAVLMLYAVRQCSLRVGASLQEGSP